MKSLLLFFILVCPLVNAQSPTGNPVSKKYRAIQKFMDQATRDNLSGVVVYISHPAYGKWIGTSGYADVQNKERLQSDHIFSMGSIGKMYNAVAVLKLAEEGRLHLDDKIEAYVSSEIINNLPDAQTVTIRQLLAHTSGFANYEADTELNRLYLSGQLKLDTLTHLNALRRYAFGKKALCKPGTEFHYSSTNYVLLALIADKVVPEGHTDYLRRLIRQQNFSNTYYRQTPPSRNIKYYGDINLDGVPEDLTAQTFETTNWFIGDDGVYAPIEEAAVFLQKLANGKILNATSWKEMTTWNNEKKPDYGLGLMADKSFPYKFLLGHSGRGIGTTTDLYYFPNQKITVAIFCNTGIRASAPKFKKSYLHLRTKIVKKLFLF
ncbi:MAG: D-alanyl-D-alanine carboxypeptidase [Cytophagales bacterium]|jgi:D-alanyl-D-alanine carboxypeptidase|nr:beta-lactamase family protein [Bacteroidota bacterium]MBS1980220.1 beta-lactamase family protein [Bacteroidota bacterium]WHZ08739.1 MAG: D-alanyl-D-alanine carboxypeptidase [Cytophagales bacterium]